MYFSQESIEKLATGYASLADKRDAALEALLTRSYRVPRAREFAAHGVSRRLKTMCHCVESIFGVLPPEREDLPSMEELVEAVVHTQAFTFNAFACLDNLAWIWVCEQELTTDRGEEIPATKIGLGKRCRIVRRSLPQEFRSHLKSLDAWFDHLENFRHALALRIPLYIPPCVVRDQDVARYELLGRQMDKALRRGNVERYEKLKLEQKGLTRYQPEMMHSPADNTKRIVFHPQLLSDFDTICDLAKRMNEALNTVPRQTTLGCAGLCRDPAPPSHRDAEGFLLEVRGKRGVGFCKSMPGAVQPYQRLLKRATADSDIWLKDESERSGKEPKFPQATDPLFPSNHIRLFNGVLRREKLKLDREGNKRTAYSLRHTYICMRLIEGADIYALAKNCRTSVEMIQKFYAAHIKDLLDASDINRMRPKRTRNFRGTPPDQHAS